MSDTLPPAPTALSDAIPVVDVGPLRDGTDPIGVGRALAKASREVGFIYVSGHGIDADLLDGARTEALTFFRLPVENKAAVKVSSGHRGWIAPGAAKMQDDALPDLKESFVWGTEGEFSDHSLRGANRWPSAAPALQRYATGFFEAADQLAQHLLTGFALGLDKPADTFLRTADRPISRASFVYYPPQQTGRDEGRFGVGPHTDFGVLTVLAQDSVGGLEVQTPQGGWIAAPPIPGTLVVNVGDLLHRWTAGVLRSTPHRVVNRSGRERLSLVLAYDPNPETVIDPRDVLGSDVDGEPPITCGDYLDWRFARAFKHRK